VITVDWKAGSRGKDEPRGQALVEFALVAPLLFIMLIAIIEAGIFVLNMETLNNATREGARFAIVHGADVRGDCPTGPMPQDRSYPVGCAEDDEGTAVKATVRSAAVGLTSPGVLSVPTPVWTDGASAVLPSGPAESTGDNGRGEFVTVYADYSYKPIIAQVFGAELLPSITISAESTLVINY
jgi:hypothetical protein